MPSTMGEFKVETPTGKAVSCTLRNKSMKSITTQLLSLPKDLRTLHPYYKRQHLASLVNFLFTKFTPVELISKAHAAPTKPSLNRMSSMFYFILFHFIFGT